MTKAEAKKAGELRAQRAKIGKRLASWRFYLAHPDLPTARGGAGMKDGNPIPKKRVAEVEKTMKALEAERKEIAAQIEALEADKDEAEAEEKPKSAVKAHGPNAKSPEEVAAEKDTVDVTGQPQAHEDVVAEAEDALLAAAGIQ